MRRINWAGPGDGLGARILSLATALALAKICDATYAFPWRVTDECPADFYELFADMPGLDIVAADKKVEAAVGARTNPLFILQQTNAALGTAITTREFLPHFVQACKSLRYSQAVEEQLAEHLGRIDQRNNVAIHIRRTDRIQHLQKNVKKLLRGRKKDLSIRIIRANGFVKAIQYACLPEQAFVYLENRALAKTLIKQLSRLENPSYTIYADSVEGLNGLAKTLERRGVPASLQVPGFCSMAGGKWHRVGIRHTTIQDALVELLVMSGSAAILQNNPASTFSIASSLIGSVEIMTAQPTHQFWQEYEKLFGHPPSTPIPANTIS